MAQSSRASDDLAVQATNDDATSCKRSKSCLKCCPMKHLQFVVLSVSCHKLYKFLVVKNYIIVMSCTGLFMQVCCSERLLER